ncbi:MAG TPA: hypothetical protein VLC09_20880, partial [Polyangiaceae bacterium]|nr:hypothetical protein [Polyangiaceae bacterium]
MSGLPAQKARPHAPLRLLAIWAATSSLIGCAAPQEAAHPAGFTEAHSQERSHRHSAESLVGSVLASPLGKGEAPAATGPMAPSELDGPRCLAELGRTDVAFRPLEQLRGVETPVEIRGPIGPVTFWVNGGAPLRLDCRMALTLRRLAPR